MGSPAVEQLWQALCESGLALVCVRGPRVRFEVLAAVDEGERWDLSWMAREVGEIAEQYPHDTDIDSGTVTP